MGVRLTQLTCASYLRTSAPKLTCNSARTITNVVQNTSELEHVRPFEDVPGPTPLPLIGNYFRFLPGFRKYDFGSLKVYDQLQKEFGDIVRFSGLAPRNDLLFIYRPEDIETVFRNEGLWPRRPPLRSLAYYRQVTRKDFFDESIGVLLDQGETWHKTRSHVNPVMMQTKVAQIYASRINNVAEDFVIRMPEFMNSSNMMSDNFIMEIHKWALESIALVALDTRLGCLDPNLPPDSEPLKMIDAVHNIFHYLQILEVKSFMWTLVSTPVWRKYVKTVDFITETSLKHINAAIERIKQNKLPDNQLSDNASVLERFLYRDPNPKKAVIMALDMLFAGIDTTSYAMANALLLLAENPQSQEKLYQEIKRVIPDPSTSITMDMLNEMRYLRACIKESMRMRPIAPGTARTTEKEIVLSNYKIPKNVDIVFANALISLMEKNFPEADKFIPERWLRDSPENPFLNVKANPFVSLPFGHGARKCVGMRFASMELEMLLTKFIYRYRWEWNQPKMEYRTDLIQKPIHPLRFTVYPR